MAPGVLAWHAVRGRSVDLLVIAAGSTLLFLLVLARLLGVLRKVKEQAAEVALLATSDPLTGLPNRRHWDAEDTVDRLGRATPRPRSFSCGLAQWNGEETDEALMIRADMALYAAKAAGRATTVRADTAAPDHADSMRR